MYRIAVDEPEPLRDWAARYADWRPFGRDWGEPERGASRRIRGAACDWDTF